MSVPDAGRAAARDAAFERDVLSLLPDVERFARALTHDAADADDLTQETILRAFRGHHTFRPGSDTRRWLFTICRNAFLRQHEREARQVPLTDGDDAELETLAAAMEHALLVRRGEHDLLDRIDVAAAIDRALDTLPPPFRVAVVLVDVEGLSYEEAAAVMEAPVGTVRSRLFRARRLLQEKLLAHARDAGVVRAPAPAPEADAAARPEPA